MTHGLDRFVGLPWVDKGRGYDGVDCYGLAFLVYRDVLGVALPSYSDRYATDADRESLARLIAGELGPWREIPNGEEQALDCALIFQEGNASHVGVVARPGLVLHAKRDHGSVVESYRTGFRRPRVVGFYRWSGDGRTPAAGR